jgi:uncharacterized protein YdhG (YjbR/CyaY superfamily)
VLATKQTFQTIDEYVKTFPKNIQKILGTIRQVIKKSAPAAEEAISYQIPTFKLNGNLVHFAAFKNHIGFYPGAEAIKVFPKEIASYKSSKGTIQFPIDKPMPLTLIRKIVEYRVKVNSSKDSKNKK